MSPLLDTPVRKILSIQLIVRDELIQSRVGLSPATIAQYKDDITNGIRFDPIIVYFDGSQYWLADGFHRTEASQQAGLKELNSTVYEGSRRDAVLYSVKANGKHGLPRNGQDKRKAVVLLLSDGEWSRWSNVQIANRCLVSEAFVRKVRDELTSHETMLAPGSYAVKIGVNKEILIAAQTNIQNETGERIVQKGNTQYTINTKNLAHNPGNRGLTHPSPMIASIQSSGEISLAPSQELSNQIVALSKKVISPYAPADKTTSASASINIKSADQDFLSVEPGQLWQIGESHFLYCGSPEDREFREKLPAKIAITLLFPRQESDLRLDWIPSGTLRKLVLFDPFFLEWDLQVFRDMLERSLDNCTSPQDPVVVLFLPDAALFLLMLAMECPCFCAEPDPIRCAAAIQTWNATAAENCYSPATLLSNFSSISSLQSQLE